MDAGRIGPMWTKLKGRLHDPLQLRIALVVAMLVTWYVAVYSPIRERIDASAKEQAKSEAHLAVVREIEALKAQAAKFRDRLPPKSDANEWVEYVLGGIREIEALKLLKLEPQGVRKHGPFDVLTLRIEIQGTFADLDAFLVWIEANPRLFRVDAVNLKPPIGFSGGLILQVTLLGVMG